MKKLLVLIVLGAAGFSGYWFFLRPPEKRACAKMAELCGDKGDRVRCERDLGELAKAASPETMSKLDRCLSDARTCPAAAGCVFGTGMHTVGDAFNEFLKGAGDAMR